MKTIVRIAAISGSLLLSGLSFAQETSPAKLTAPSAVPAYTKEVAQPATAPAAATKPRVNDGWRTMPLGSMVKQLGLTPEQTQQGKELNSKYMKLYQGLDENMPLEERKVKVKALMDERDVEAKAMLTPEQLENYANLRSPSGAPVTKEKMPVDEKMQAGPAPKDQAPQQKK